MPLLSKDWHQGHEHVIGETDFTHPTLPNESVKFTVCLASPKFVESRITTDFPKVSLKSVKDFVMLHSVPALKQMASNGKLSFVLDKEQVDLVRGVHFFFDARD